MRTNEFELIDKLSEIVNSTSARVLKGIGDDCAVVIPPHGSMLMTSDTMVEGVHFDLKTISWRDLGYKALAINLSDIAAMGGYPLYATVSLGIPDRIEIESLMEMYRGMKVLATLFQVDIVGGNTSRSPHSLFIDIALVGDTNEGGIRRSGAEPGELIAVTGELGSSHAGLEVLRSEDELLSQKYSILLQRHFRPTPRLDVGQTLAKKGIATSMIDISDGLSSEIHHLCRNSRTGALLNADIFPLSKETRELAEFKKQDPFIWALSGGEQYELLFTFCEKDQALVEAIATECDVPISVIGKMKAAEQGINWERDGVRKPLLSTGWKHFQ